VDEIRTLFPIGPNHRSRQFEILHDAQIDEHVLHLRHIRQAFKHHAMRGSLRNIAPEQQHAVAAAESKGVAECVAHVPGGIVELDLRAGFRAHGILVNSQAFTKTAHIWGVGNNDKGTNSNRIVLFEKD